MSVSKLFLNVIILLQLCLVSVEYSQTFLMRDQPGEKIKIGFNYSKALYSEYLDATALSGIYRLSFSSPISSKFNLIGEIPFVHSDYRVKTHYNMYSQNINGLGNIFIGLQAYTDIGKNNNSVVTFGLSLPTSNAEHPAASHYSDYYYFYQYLHQILGIYFNYGFRKEFENGFIYGFEAGPNLVLSTEDGFGNSGEILIHYAVNSGYRFGRLLLNAEFCGIGIVSSSSIEFADRFTNLLNLGFAWKEGMVIPRLYYSIYLKELIRDKIDGVFGLGLKVLL